MSNPKEQFAANYGVRFNNTSYKSRNYVVVTTMFMGDVQVEQLVSYGEGVFICLFQMEF